MAVIQNDIEHESSKIISGYKIIFKVNVIGINFNNYCSPQFDKLFYARNDIINNFISSSNNILPIYTLSEYLFYRNCLKIIIQLYHFK